MVIKTCKINFDYKKKLAGNRLSTPFFIDSKYSETAFKWRADGRDEFAPDCPSTKESANHRFLSGGGLLPCQSGDRFTAIMSSASNAAGAA